MKKRAYFLAVITFVIFIIVALNYRQPAFTAFDEKMASYLKGNQFFIAFHYIGETIFVVIVAVLMLLQLWIRERNYRGMLLILATLAAGNVLNQLLKHYFMRPRPEIVDQLTSYSFPSGHSQMTVLYLLTVAYLFAEMTSSKKKVVAIWVTSVVLACCVGFARVAESRHFATDVVAGWSIGYTWFAVCVYWYEARKRVFKSKNL